MRKKSKNAPLFGANISPSCSYCRENVGAGEEPVCKLRQKMPENGKCLHYQYNPLLRTPRTSPTLPASNLDPEDFKL